MKIPNPQAWRRYLHPSDPDSEDVPELIEVDDAYLEMAAENPKSDYWGLKNYDPANRPK